MINFDALNEAKKINITYVDNNVDKEYVKQFRKQNGLTQVGLANLMGVTKKTIEKWEQGRNKVSGSSSILFYLYCKNPELISEVRCVKEVFCNAEEEFVVIQEKELTVDNDSIIYQESDIDDRRITKGYKRSKMSEFAYGY